MKSRTMPKETPDFDKKYIMLIKKFMRRIDKKNETMNADAVPVKSGKPFSFFQKSKKLSDYGVFSRKRLEKRRFACYIIIINEIDHH